MPPKQRHSIMWRSARNEPYPTQNTCPPQRSHRQSESIAAKPPRRGKVRRRFLQRRRSIASSFLSLWLGIRQAAPIDGEKPRRSQRSWGPFCRSALLNRFPLRAFLQFLAPDA